MSTAAIIGGVSAVAQGTIGAVGAESAANTQANAEGKAIKQQQQEWQQKQANEAPFLSAGQSALPQLEADVNNPAFSQYPGGAFTAPTLAEAEQTPGYQFTLEQGTNAINQNAAANGSLFSGNTGKALTDYGQGLASTTYNQDYQRALQTYMENYGVWNQDTTNQVNRLQTLANLGSNTAAQLGQQGQAASTNIGNELVGQGTALASGTVGATNALTGAIGGFTSSLPLYSLLAQQQKMLNQSGYNPAADPNGDPLNPAYG
jgi:hypothetical protein